MTIAAPASTSSTTSVPLPTPDPAPSSEEAATRFAVAYSSYSYDVDRRAAALGLARWATPELGARLVQQAEADPAWAGVVSRHEISVAQVETAYPGEDAPGTFTAVLTQHIRSDRGEADRRPVLVVRAVPVEGGWLAAAVSP